MEDVKSNIANNIVELRKSKKWTQAELAEKLNYTDKAISKWERGESTPDVEILYQMSLIFGVTVDYFFHKDSSENINKYIMPKKFYQRRVALLSLLITAVFFIAVVVFVYAVIKEVENVKRYWVSFVWAVPISCLAISLFFKKNNMSKGIPYSTSILVWSALAAIYLQGLVVGENIWLLFLIGIPLQIAVIIAHYIKK